MRNSEQFLFSCLDCKDKTLVPTLANSPKRNVMTQIHTYRKTSKTDRCIYYFLMKDCILNIFQNM